MLQQTQDPWVSREKHGMMVRASDFLKHLYITVNCKPYTSLHFRKKTILELNTNPQTNIFLVPSTICKKKTSD